MARTAQPTEPQEGNLGPCFVPPPAQEALRSPGLGDPSPLLTHHRLPGKVAAVQALHFPGAVSLSLAHSPDLR